MSFSTGFRKCKKCGKTLFGLFDGELCDECEKAEQEPLTEEDYKELHDRFGDYVEFVVRDMVSGTGERWTKTGDKKNDNY